MGSTNATHLLLLSVLGWGSAASTGCSTDFNPATCDLDSDCGTGSVCEIRSAVNVCVAAAEATIRIGESAPATGTNQDLGVGMKLGIDLAFKEANDAGGIRGRKLELEFRDDGYVPDVADLKVRELTDVKTTNEAPRCPTTTMPPVATDPAASTTRLDRGPNAVLAILGNVGTPTMARSAPIAVETQTLFFGAFTGATNMLRDTKAGECGKFIFNVRGSYAQEARATVEYFKGKKGITDYRNVISFDQHDSFGDAGFNGLVAAWNAVFGEGSGASSVKRFQYERGIDPATTVPPQVAAATAYIESRLVAQPSGTVTIGVMMTDTHSYGEVFIKGVRDWQYDGQTSAGKSTRLQLAFSNVSFVGPNTLAAQLVADGAITNRPGAHYTDDVVVSQVVPNYQADQSEVVVRYNQLIAASGATPSFVSLEGYIAARVFIAGLMAHKGPFTPANLIPTFESLPDLALGLGANAGFSGASHQYTQSVWGTSIGTDGRFSNLYFWSLGQDITFY